MPDASPFLNLPYIQASQAQKHVTHNEAVQFLDVVVQLSVRSASQVAPPASPTSQDRYVVPVGATGDWAGQDMSVAAWAETYWQFYVPSAGWQSWVEDTNQLVVFDGAQWAGTIGDFQNLDGIGIQSSFDTTNRLSVSSAATLLNHDGAGHQLKINKNLETDTASLLYQSGFSGRAEVGLTGSDDLSVKVTPDGTTWSDALTIKTDGRIGVGTSAPAEQLEVAGNVLATAHLTPSDARLKTDIKPASNPGVAIDALRVVSYQWRNGGGVDYGLIAQDAANTIPENVKAGDIGADVSKPWSIDYASLVPMLIKEIQDLRARLSDIEGRRG